MRSSMRPPSWTTGTRRTWEPAMRRSARGCPPSTWWAAAAEPTIVTSPGSATPGSPARPDCGSVHKPATDGPAAELVAVRELELAQDRADVSLDRLHRDVEPEADLLVEVAAGDVAEHLSLAGRQLVELGVDLLGGQVAGEGV